MKLLDIFKDIEKQFQVLFKSIQNLQTIKKVESEYNIFFENQGLFFKLFKQIKGFKVDFKKLKKSELIEFNQKKSEVINKINLLRKEAIIIKEKKINELKLNDLKIFAQKKCIEKQHISGSIHPITAETWNIKQIFLKMGFELHSSPDIDLEKINFSDLNIPEYHPSRSMHDTFYIEKDENLHSSQVLRTHTSNAQIRYLQEHGAKPARVLSIGRVYRSDQDSTHSPMFHQVEGFCIGNVTFANLKYCLTKFLRDFFNKDDLKIRFRPSYFPFTEPSIEVDIAYDVIDGKLILNGDKWLEVLGAGMINKKVFQNCGINQKVQGFAFGLGLTRFVMLKYNIPSLNFYGSTDARWLRNFHNLNI